MRVLLLQDVLLAVQRLVAVVAVKAFSHVDTQLYSNLLPKEKTQTLASGPLHAPCRRGQGGRQTFQRSSFSVKPLLAEGAWGLKALHALEQSFLTGSECRISEKAAEPPLHPCYV